MGKRTGKNDGNTTRDKLLDAGLELFGLHGYGGTSTRTLAARAGVNLGAIRYHFDGKEGLYRAIIKRAVAEKSGEVGPCVAAVRGICMDPGADREALDGALQTLVGTMVEVMLGNPRTRAFSRLMMQEQIAPTAAYGLLHEGFFDKVHGAWTMLVGRLTGLAPGSDELKLRTVSVMGQIMIFRIGMPAILRQLGREKFSPEDMECIEAIALQQVRAIVNNATPVCGEDKP